MFQHTSEFLARLDGVVSSANGWEARCPCRQDDRNPSLSIHENEDGKIVLFCHRNGGCSTPEICKSVGVEIKDLWPKDAQKATEDFYPKQERPKLKFVAKYEYTDEDGNILFEKVRYVEPDGKKTFRQRKPDGSGGWTYKLGDTPKVLYNLPAVLKAKAEGDTVFLVEGEKDADALIEMGACATTMPGGAGKWLDIHTEALAGAVVDIISDNDEPGRRHALLVARLLTEAGSDVAVWRCPQHKDIYDHIEAGLAVESVEQVNIDDLAKEFEGQSVQAEEQPEDGDEPEVAEEELTPHERALAKIAELLDSGRKPQSVLLKIADVALAADDNVMERDEGKLVNWVDFIEEEVDDSYDWVIPGLLEKQERVMVVAAEGVGKTMLARQVAICSGFGVHPFTFQRMPRVRTLTVDLENPERIIRRTSTSIVGAARSMGYERTGDIHLVIKPDGLNLLSVADRMILEEHIEKVEPELLVMGPLYKAFLDPGTRTSEAVAIEVAKYLDRIRATYGVALWLEHHAPLGTSMTSRELRPFGSAVWSRWPEFGLALQPDPTAHGQYIYDVNHFRGARDLRAWPTSMTRGKKFPFEVLEFLDVS
jgi:5S rRNA maturation endonuclease (ribonuclease M5)